LKTATERPFPKQHAGFARPLIYEWAKVLFEVGYHPELNQPELKGTPLFETQAQLAGLMSHWKLKVASTILQNAIYGVPGIDPDPAPRPSLFLYSKAAIEVHLREQKRETHVIETIVGRYKFVCQKAKLTVLSEKKPERKWEGKRNGLAILKEECGALAEAKTIVEAREILGARGWTTAKIAVFERGPTLSVDQLYAALAPDSLRAG